MEKVSHVFDANKLEEPALSDVIQPYTVRCTCTACCLGVLTFSCPAVKEFSISGPHPLAELISHWPIIVDLVPLMQCCRPYLIASKATVVAANCHLIATVARPA